MKILFLIPYPLHQAPSQRFRFEQYTTILKDKGHKLSFQSFLQSHNWQLFFKRGKNAAKIIALTAGLIRRFGILFRVPVFDFVFIHREATPLGPPVIEWIIRTILRKKIIYDFDDAIWTTDRSTESTIVAWIKWRSKVRLICRWSHKISCGNEYLSAYARQFNGQVVFNPTTIDTLNLHRPENYRRGSSPGVTIGWTGSHSTLKYLDGFGIILEKLKNRFPFVRFVIIADRPPLLSDDWVTFVPWSKDTEMEDLATFDIGIMPLPDDEWSKGKCGFKALQYMAMEIATVASPVGVNTSIIDHGVNGFLCKTETEWINTLEMLIVDAALRQRIGKKGREKVTNAYSVSSNAGVFLSLFE